MPVIGAPPTLSLEHIVLASDFQPAAEAATIYAQAFGHRFDCRITLAHVIDLSVASRSEDAVVGINLDEMRRASAENLERTASELRADGLKIETWESEALNPAGTLIHFAGSASADLIVLGTNARRSLSRFILGSFAEGVIHQASCPVLTVGPQALPLPAGPLAFRTVLFATDLQPHTARSAALALSLAEDSLARVVLCHVIEHPEGDIVRAFAQEENALQAMQRLIPAVDCNWIDTDCTVEYGRPAERIVALAEKIGADLVVMGARHTPLWTTHFTLGTVDAVLERIKCPVLTI